MTPSQFVIYSEPAAHMFATVHIEFSSCGLLVVVLLF